MQAQKAEQFFASRMAEQEQQRRDALKKGPMYRLDWVSPACHCCLSASCTQLALSLPCIY